LRLELVSQASELTGSCLTVAGSLPACSTLIRSRQNRENCIAKTTLDLAKRLRIILFCEQWFTGRLIPFLYRIKASATSS
jgi:hypothetical protein